MIDSNATLDQSKAARVTVEYDDLYGANSGPWTTEGFIAAVYTSPEAETAEGGTQVASRLPAAACASLFSKQNRVQRRRRTSVYLDEFAALLFRQIAPAQFHARLQHVR
jgi:hypothetical protein